ncbi:MAG: lysophospholipid acyltransferase family protein [Solirubrobacterales bacterium]
MSAEAAEIPCSPPALSSAGAPVEGWRVYQAIRFILRPLRWWVRLEVKGLDNLPLRGPALVVANHDSWLDPLVIVEAMAWRRRLLRFLAKSSLWKSRILAWILDGAVQIPIERGANDTAAMESAVEAIGRGEMIGIFPEGTLSRGKVLRAKRGVARLAKASPGVPIVLVAVTGSTVLKRFPKRPRVEAEFFLPSGGQPRADEDPAELSQRLLDDIRDKAPQIF